MSGPTIDRANSSGDIWTPQPFIKAVEAKFGPLAVDLSAAGPWCAKAPRWITPEQDSLTQDWGEWVGDGLGWDNPPYGNITPWAHKHAYELGGKGTRTLLLVPASIGARWFERWVWLFADVYSIGRLKFDNCFSRKTGKLITTAYVKDLILCHYAPKTGERLIFWNWKEEL